MISTNSKGSAIIMVLLVLLVLSILGITLFNMDIIHLNIVDSDKLYQAAYYYAEAGILQQIETMRSSMEELYNDPNINDRTTFLISIFKTPINPPEFDDYLGERVRITITCKKNEKTPGNDEFIIISTCKLGKITRSIKAKVCTVWMDPNDVEFKLDNNIFSIVAWEEL